MENEKLFEQCKEKIFKAFLSLSEEDKQKILQDGYAVEIKAKKIIKRIDYDSLEQTTDFNKLLEKLLESESREKAEEILNQELQCKKDFIQFAKFIEVSAQSKDSINVLRTRIIESTIGAKLRSEAIQGKI